MSATVSIVPLVLLMEAAGVTLLAALFVLWYLTRRWTPPSPPDDEEFGPWEPDPDGKSIPAATRRSMRLAA